MGGSARYLGGAIASPLNLMHVGGDAASALPAVGFLKPEEAWNIDTKIDDGLPGRGNFLQFANSILANCVSDDSFTATYLLGGAEKACIGIVPLR